MTLFSVTLHSLRRQRGKKGFLVAAMALSVCTALVLFSFVESQSLELESQFDEFGANIVITPHTDDLTLTYGGINLTGIVTNVHEIRSNDVARIRTIPNSKNIRAVSPKLLGAGELSMDGAVNEALIVGVDFEEELRIKGWWSIDGRYPESQYEVIAGAKAAEKLDLRMGSTFDLGEYSLTVTGVLFPTGGQDDTAILAPISFVEQLLDKRGKVSLVEVSALCVDCPIDDLVAQISEVLPGADVQAVRQVMEQRMQVVRQFGRFASAILAVLLILCSLFIFATISGAVADRRREIGVMRAIGFSGSHIVRVVLSESSILGIIAGVAGIAISQPIIRRVVPALTGSDVVIRDPIIVLFSLFAAVLLAVISSIAPAIRASKFDPVAAIAGG